MREAKRHGIKEVPVVVVVCQADDDRLRRVRDDNVQRVKINEEAVREGVRIVRRVTTAKPCWVHGNASPNITDQKLREFLDLPALAS